MNRYGRRGFVPPLRGRIAQAAAGGPIRQRNELRFVTLEARKAQEG